MIQTPGEKNIKVSTHPAHYRVWGKQLHTRFQNSIRPAPKITWQGNRTSKPLCPKSLYCIHLLLWSCFITCRSFYSKCFLRKAHKEWLLGLYIYQVWLRMVSHLLTQSAIKLTINQLLVYFYLFFCLFFLTQQLDTPTNTTPSLINSIQWIPVI